MAPQPVSRRGSRSNDDRKRWLDHHHCRTYEIALRFTRALGASADLRDLEFLKDHIIDFLKPWQKETAVHRFARVIADEMFLDDTDGPYVYVYDDVGVGAGKARRYLPVDVALHVYGIDRGEMFTIPEKGAQVRKGNVTSWVESPEVADACYDYTLDLQQTELYDKLLAQIADEVFHTVFPNRALLSQLNDILAIYVGQEGPETLSDSENDELAFLFHEEGRLKRVTPPRWAKRAVFFRDRGHCSYCGKDLTGYIDALPSMQFDHMVPLRLGGLNDVTNLQLLCQPCNNKKSARPVRASRKYRRYYERAGPR